MRSTSATKPTSSSSVITAPAGIWTREAVMAAISGEVYSLRLGARERRVELALRVAGEVRGAGERRRLAGELARFVGPSLIERPPRPRLGRGALEPRRPVDSMGRIEAAEGALE